MNIRLLLIAGLVLATMPACKPEQTNKTPEQPSSAAPAFVSEETAPAPPAFEEKSEEQLTVHEIPTAQMGILPVRPDMIKVEGADMQIRLSPRMKEAKDWTSSFVKHYPAIRDCLAAHTDPRAFIADVKSVSETVTIITTGNHIEGTIGTCEMSPQGGKPVSIGFVEQEEFSFSGPVFYPNGSLSTYTINNQECYERETVIARPGGLIGILVYTKPECADKVPAAPAISNEP